ncbi:hypothetical protein Hypma_000378 [Hypsizygus marmoreus]|uniref:Uncharacterized protein n=1 Tax=Hypsizygus marmoreus TaxID=39966 RepID=A0A369JAN5_HYPMA|nr:hypothetical protein Hypma_000378 [Hypsizygus marmoreus]
MKGGQDEIGTANEGNEGISPNAPIPRILNTAMKSTSSCTPAVDSGDRWSRRRLADDGQRRLKKPIIFTIFDPSTRN